MKTMSYDIEAGFKKTETTERNDANEKQNNIYAFVLQNILTLKFNIKSQDNILASEKPPDVNNDIFITKDDFFDPVRTFDVTSEGTGVNDAIVFEESSTKSPADISLKNLDITFASKSKSSSIVPVPGSESEYRYLFHHRKVAAWF